MQSLSESQWPFFFFSGNEKADPKIHMELQVTLNSSILGEKKITKLEDSYFLISSLQQSYSYQTEWC